MRILLFCLVASLISTSQCFAEPVRLEAILPHLIAQTNRSAAETHCYEHLNKLGAANQDQYKVLVETLFKEKNKQGLIDSQRVRDLIDPILLTLESQASKAASSKSSDKKKPASKKKKRKTPASALSDRTVVCDTLDINRIAQDPDSGKRHLKDSCNNPVQSAKSVLTPSAIAIKHGFKYLRQLTPCDNIPSILSDGVLKSSKKTGISTYGGNKYVFLQLGDTDQPDGKILGHRDGDCILFMSLDLLDKNRNYHLSLGWPYGEYEDDSSSRPDNLKHFESLMEEISLIEAPEKAPEEYKINEVVFYQDLQLDSLVQVALPESSKNTKEDLEKLAEVKALLSNQGIQVKTYRSESQLRWQSKQK